jgi:hypothetical protein
MKISKILETIGDADIPESILVGLGLVERDHLIDANEVTNLTGIKNGYQVISRLKLKYGLDYDEAKIPLSILKKHYHLK